jgi:hypothetical protein
MKTSSKLNLAWKAYKAFKWGKSALEMTTAGTETIEAAKETFDLLKETKDSVINLVEVSKSVTDISMVDIFLQKMKEKGQ